VYTTILGSYYHAVNVFYARPFWLDNWSANLGVVYFNEDNYINILNQENSMLALGMLYRL
jgi:hypothetical protein